MGVVVGGVGAQGAEVVVRVVAEPAEALVGEQIRYVITVEAPEGFEVILPSIPSLEALAIEDTGTELPRKQDGAVIRERWALLSSYTVGAYGIPAPVVTYRAPDEGKREAYGEAVTVTVESLLPYDWEDQDVRGVKPPVAVRAYGWWLWLAGMLALIGAAAAAWWWAKRRRPSARPVVRIPPHQIALAALEALRRERLPEQGRFEEYYVRLSLIARRYIEGRFALRAPEMTSEEFLLSASQARELTVEPRQRLREFLEHCDLVKFARYQPSGHEADQAFASARRFVEDTTPAPEPVDSTAGEVVG